MAVKARLAPKIKTVAVARVVTRGTSGAEVVATCGGSKELIDITNLGIQRGLIGSVLVYGLNKSGQAVEKFCMSFAGDNSGDTIIEDDDSRTMLGRIDGGMERAVSLYAGRLQAKGLRPAFYFTFHDTIYDDPVKLAQARRELDLSGVDAPPWLAGFDEKPVVGMTTAKDKGQSWSISTAARRKSVVAEPRQTGGQS